MGSSTFAARAVWTLNQQVVILPVVQGTSYDINFQYLEDDGVTPVNLTGSTPFVEVRKYAGAPQNELLLTLGLGVTMNPIQGKLLITLPTDGLSLGPHYWYVYLSAGSLLVRGVVDVTR